MPAEERRLEITWEDPRITVEAARGRRGLDILREIADGQLPSPPITRLMSLRLIEVEEGRVVFEGLPGEQHYNPIGSVHGGLAATLLDSAMGCAVHSLLPAEAAYTTLELKVNYLRPMTAATGPVRAEGTVIHLGRRVATAEGRVVGADGTLYAHGTTTCLIMRE